DETDVADRLTLHGPVEQLADEGLTLAPRERVEVEAPAPEPDAVVVDAGGPGGVAAEPSPLAGGDEPDRAGRLAGAAGHANDVGDLADLGATRVDQRPAHHPERVDHVACHEAQATPHPSSARVRPRLFSRRSGAFDLDE